MHLCLWQASRQAQANLVSSAIMPVSTRPAFSPKATFAIYDWSLLGAAATLRFLDYKSTVKCLSDPANFHEVELPKALAGEQSSGVCGLRDRHRSR
jgi:hypothetical protein